MSLSRSTLGQGFHVQLKNPVNNTTDVLEIPVHTNETIGDLRRTFHVKYVEDLFFLGNICNFEKTPGENVQIEFRVQISVNGRKSKVCLRQSQSLIHPTDNHSGIMSEYSSSSTAVE